MGTTPLGSQVEGLLREIPIATYVRNDYYDDSWMAGVNVRAEEANRLGLTNASIAQQLSGAFSGSSVTTFWEGDRQVDVLLRLDADQRRGFDDVRNAYLTSTLTGNACRFVRWRNSSRRGRSPGSSGGTASEL
jgi:multidrug efflux pump subunit AcrB